MKLFLYKGRPCKVTSRWSQINIDNETIAMVEVEFTDINEGYEFDECELSELAPLQTEADHTDDLEAELC